MGAPTWSLRELPPAKILHDLVGSSIEAPRSLSGLTQAIDFSGGGYWRLDMKAVQIHNEVGHRAWLRWRNRLNGGVGTVVVPLLNDIVMVGGENVPFSDGTLHSDGTGHRGADIIAAIGAAAAKNAGTVQILVLAAARALLEADMFSIRHPTKDWRAYAITSIDTVVDVPAGKLYTVGIRPTLREAITAADFVDFWRPRCLMRLSAGKTMAWEPEKFWISRPDVSFVEAL